MQVSHYQVKGKNLTELSNQTPNNDRVRKLKKSPDLFGFLESMKCEAEFGDLILWNLVWFDQTGFVKDFGDGNL